MESADLDGDMVGDNADTDVDGDGVPNAMDAFPRDDSESADLDGDMVGDNADPDVDGDGVPNAMDAFPRDPMESADLDGDMVGDNADTDVDGDGVPNAMDAFPRDPMESADLDGDMVGDNADTDVDGDGVPNAMDAFPRDPMESADLDGDMVGDNADTDVDGDGVPNDDDLFPRDPMDHADLDGDGIGDNADDDRDGDGFANVADDFPNRPDEWRDSDGDGYGNNEDVFPFNADEWEDEDGDGYGDNMADAFPGNPDEWADADGDGVGDNTDAFPGRDDRVSSRLFQAANAYDVMDNPATPADETAAEVAMVGAAMAASANAADGNQSAGTTASATWPADGFNVAGTANNDADGNPVPGKLSIMVDPGGSGTAIPFELRESRDPTDLNDDGDTDDDGEGRIINTAMMIDDLGAFQGYELWEDDGDANTVTDSARAIVFTDKQQDTHATAAMPAVAAKALTNTQASSGTVTVLGTRNADGNYTGVTFFEAGADTEDSGFGFASGTLTCAAGATCTATTNADGSITVTGYTFSGTRSARTATAATGNTVNNDYLMFGLWLDEAADGADTFGAFASGGTDYAANAVNEITGSATYTGKAVGAHHKTGEDVNWFDGDASLTAEFGENDEAGTISGEISNISVNGGEALSDPIQLRQAALNGTATFNGVARMGAATVDPVDDSVSTPFAGTWSGSFFGASEAVEDDTTTPENEAVPAGQLAPAAVAGTFGVTMTDDMDTMIMSDDVIETFVGAFGAHCSTGCPED